VRARYNLMVLSPTDAELVNMGVYDHTRSMLWITVEVSVSTSASASASASGSKQQKHQQRQQMIMVSGPTRVSPQANLYKL
jgi:hypothetical protein